MATPVTGQNPGLRTVIKLGEIMRVMATISMPVEAGSRSIKDGTIAKVVQEAADRWKPEAMYFGSLHGQRTMFMVMDMTDPSQMVPFSEPIFMGLEASIELTPVMNADDLQRGMAQLG